MFKSMSGSDSRSPFVLLLAVAFLGLVVLAQQIYFSPRVKAASSTIVISEVDADTPLAGTDTANEWFELQNVSAGNITLTNWTITDNVSSDAVPIVTIGPGGHVIVAATAAGFASEHPGFTGTVLTIGDGAIGNGLANGGDALILKNENAVVVDGLSWGSNTTVLNPSAGIDSATNTNQRNAAGTDTDTAADWTRVAETPNGNINFPPTPTNPTGVGVAIPSALLAGSQTLLTVTVTPGSNPASTGLSVSGDLSSIGGSATQQFFDDGTNGDDVVGNNVFSYSATVSIATTPGEKTSPFSIADAQSRSGSGNISLTVTLHDPTEHMLMGNPSNAIADPSMTTNFLMMKTQYALSYNCSRGAPNWTSWHLDSTWLGSVLRQDDFRPDPDLPLGCHRVQGGDFVGSGFDRGHMCPSADRTSTIEDNSATFLMTNMVAQAPDNNQGPWAAFEEYLRTFVLDDDSEVYILSGGIGTGGTGDNGYAETIADGFVTVPEVIWKVALILPDGDNDLSRVDNNTRTIAVIMPNTNGDASHQWRRYLATVDQVEALTGYNFYSNVPTAVQDVIEARLDPPPTPSVVQLSATNYGVTEDCTTVTITVNRVGDTSGPAIVNYSTSDVTASERRDYINATGRLSFAPGETSKTLLLLINEDSYVEGPETFNVNLSNPSGAGLGAPPTATVTITDDAIESATNVIDDPRNFVCQHYHDFLNRHPDQAGWDFWTNQITSCGTDAQCIEVKRINVSAAFYLSIEFQETGYLVERIYKASYGDASGTSTFNGAHQLPVPIVRFNEFLPDTLAIGQGVIVNQPGWEQVLENNKQAFTLEFVQRSRFTSAFPASLTPAQFVDTLNANGGSPLSQSERDQLVNSLSSGAMTRAQVLRAVAEDPDLKTTEVNRAFVLMQYFGYLRRNPNDPQDSDYTGYDFWLTKLNQFDGNFVNAEMVKAFIVSGEYRQRFGP